MADISAKQLGLRKSDLPHSIIEVISTLTKAGFEAYIVGGGVRDNLLGLDPKDFDAVTNAKPQEIKDIFGKRCRIIGRRFQLAHVYSGKEMIEVATFRAPPKGDAHTTDEGMLVRDNVWGNIKQDSTRRDFSINAMYYQPIQGIVKDFCNASVDIENKTLRLLGNAKTRIEEDPVRLLRALRFKAKLGFEFDDDLEEQFNTTNWALLEQVSPHRLYDESQKMFTGGYIVPLLPLLYEYGAMAHLFLHAGESPSELINHVAYNTDKRIGSGKSINPAFFYAGLLWNNYLHQLDKNKKRNMTFDESQKKASAQVIDRQRKHTAIPRFHEQFIKDTWLLQPRLANPRTKTIIHLSEHPRFRAGYDFLLLREQCGENDTPLAESTNGMGEWWQNFQTLSEKEQLRVAKKFDDNVSGGRRKKRRHSENSNVESSNSEHRNTANKSTRNNTTKEEVFNSSNKTHLAKPPKNTSKIKQQPKPQTIQESQEKAQLQLLSLAMQQVTYSNQNTIVNSRQKPNDKQPSPLFIVDNAATNTNSTVNNDYHADKPRDSNQLTKPSPNSMPNKPKHIKAMDNKPDQATKQVIKTNPKTPDNNRETIQLNLKVSKLQTLLLQSSGIPKKRVRKTL